MSSYRLVIWKYKQIGKTKEFLHFGWPRPLKTPDPHQTPSNIEIVSQGQI